MIIITIFLFMIASIHGYVLATHIMIALYGLGLIAHGFAYVGYASGIVDYKPSKQIYSRGKLFLIQMIHIAFLMHLYLLGFTIFAICCITIMTMNVGINLMRES